MKNIMAFLRPRKKFNNFFTNVLAEEKTDEQGNGTEQGGTGEKPKEVEIPKANGTVNFEELIAKARAEEKGKLYPQIEKLKASNNDLLLVVAERDKEIAELKKQNEKLTGDLTKLQTETEEGTKTNKTVQEQALTISQLQKEKDDLQKKYDEDILLLKLASYKEKKIAEANGEIIPELVTGSTEEEINASVELAQKRYVEIQEKALSGVQMPYSNPASSQMQIFAEKSIDEIASMTPAEYMEYRKSLGMK